MDNEYKAAKEAFVSGLTGSTVTQVALVSAIAPASMAASRVIHGFLARRRERRGAPRWTTMQTAIFEYFTTVLPCLLAFTRTDWAVYLLLLLLLGAVIAVRLDRAYVLLRSRLACHTDHWRPVHRLVAPLRPASLQLLGAPRKPFVSLYRSTMMVATCTAILAVDFPVFPRSYAKTETFGTSMMDVGVGSFLLSNALVFNTKGGGRAGGLLAFLKGLLPLLCLGIGRLVMVKASNYQEHVSEYGMHWNFFFTLLVVMLLFRLLPPLAPALIGPAGVLVVVLYQLVLSGGVFGASLSDYIVREERTDWFFDMNREGIASSFGYLSLFMLGVAIGHLLLKNRAGASASSWYLAWAWLVVLAVAGYGALAYVEAAIQPVSRRMANLPYVLFVFAYNMQQLASFLFIDLFLPPGGGVIATAINKHPLATFLAANILTGTVNGMMQTIYASTATSLAVLAVYTFAVSVGVVGLVQLTGGMQAAPKRIA